MPKTYNIVISEEQRAALHALLLTTGGRESDNDEDNPLVYWIAMLEALPVNEEEVPGSLHGFCL